MSRNELLFAAFAIKSRVASRGVSRLGVKLLRRHSRIRQLMLAKCRSSTKCSSRYQLENKAALVNVSSDEEFYHHFHLSKTTFEELLKQLPRGAPRCQGGRPGTSQRLALQITLYLLANSKCTYHKVSLLFGVGERTCYYLFQKTCSQLVQITPRYIKWPSGEEQKRVLAAFNASQGKNGMPTVIGCVGGTHIPIRTVSDDESYLNTSGYHSVILQAVSDSRGLFTNVFAGWPGSADYSCVWRASDLYKALASNDQQVVSHGSHLLGDSAYPLDTFLMAPFKDNHCLTDQENLFNSQLDSTRAAIRCALAHLKGRFSCLTATINSGDIVLIRNIIISCCLLHNFCILHNDYSGDYPLFHDTENITCEVEQTSDFQALSKRKRIMRDLWKNK